MLTEIQWAWIQSSLKQIFAGTVSKENTAKAYRTIAEIFQMAANRVEASVIDDINDRLMTTKPVEM